MAIHPFHLSFAVDDLERAKRFYGEVLQCRVRHEDEHSIDFDFFGHVVSARLADGGSVSSARSGGESGSLWSFGVCLDSERWDALTAVVSRAGVALGEPPSVSPDRLMLRDPAGNTLEFILGRGRSAPVAANDEAIGMTIDPAAIGATLTAVTMGIDAFERSRPRGTSLLDGEGLVPIYMGTDLVPARRYASWDEVQEDLAALESSVGQVPDGTRAVFLRGMLTSLKVAVRLFAGASPSFEEKVRDLVGAPIGPVDPAVIEDIRGRLDSLLRRQGAVRGDLGERIKAWEEGRFVDPERLEATFSELLAQAKARTDARIIDTGDYEMALNPVRDMPFTARCNFNQGQMDLNVDQRFTRSALKHLVCHEVHPGHVTQLLYTRAEVEAGRSDADALLCTANTVTGCVQEGIGDQAVQLIDWIEDEDDEIHLELRRLRSAAQTSAAWHLMVDGWPADRVAEYLRRTAFGQEAWIQGRLRMAAHPFRGPFIASYWAGNESVRRVRERVPASQRPAFLTYLYGQVHSPESLEMFSPATP
ncbi:MULTISPECIES: VOC family protein [unclassified Inquilinus]|uniref:VOC family protein n=1 Tax=unclassified Inquilinus TaxID=2645927 RepID=UPI003F8FAF1C